MRNWGSLFHVKLPNFSPKLHASPGQIFDRSALSACLSESITVREDVETVSASKLRVPVPNARLKRWRSPRNLFRARVKLYEQRPREDVGCAVDFRFRDEL